MRTFLIGGLSLVVLFSAFLLMQEVRRDPPQIVVSLSIDEVRDMCNRHGYSAEDFWERARTVGVTAGVIRAQSLNDHLDHGEVLYFSRADAEKWILAGLISPRSPLKGNSLWTRDPTLFSHLSETARLHGIPVSTQSYGGVYILALPLEMNVKAFPASFDLHWMRFVVAQGLIPILRADRFEDFVPLWNEVVADISRSPIYFFDFPMPGNMNLNGRWIAFSSAQMSHRPPVVMGGTNLFERRPRGILTAAGVDVDGEKASVLQAVWGRGSSLLLVRLNGERGVDENLDAVRRLIYQLRSGGFSLNTSLVDQRFSHSGWEVWIRYLVAVFLAVLAPLFSMRYGLQVLRNVCGRSRGIPLPGALNRSEGLRSLLLQASPAPEIVAALFAVVALACGLGLCCYAFLAMSEWRLGMFRAPWVPWTTALPLLISASSLYSFDLRSWKKRLRQSMTYAGVLQGFSAVIVIAVIFSPRYFMDIMGASSMVESSVLQVAWWLPARWRELLIGYPCLIIGLWKHCRYWQSLSSSHGHQVEESRPWLLAGLLGPIGIVHAMGLSQVPFQLLLIETCWGVFAGLIVVLMGFGAMWARRWEIQWLR